MPHHATTLAGRWQEMVFWSALTLAIHPLLALLNLWLLSPEGEALMPSLLAHISRRHLALQMLSDWLVALPFAIAFSLAIAAPIYLTRLQRLPMPYALLLINPLLVLLCFTLFGLHFGLYGAPLLLGNLAFVLAWRFAGGPR